MRSIIASKFFSTLLAVRLMLIGLAVVLPQTQAAELTDLYQAEVDANQSQSQWQQAAMAAVLVKLTGSEQILTQGAIAAELKNSANYIRQFQQVQQQGRNLMQVQLDQQKITSLLQQQQVAIWGSRRPDLLIWLTEKTIDQAKFVLDAEHPLRQALAAQAKQRGLSFVYPMYDVDDLAVVSEAQLVAGDWSGLSLAATRYQADQVLGLLVEQTVDASGQASVKLVRQQLVAGAVVQQEYIAADWNTVVQQLAQALAAELASQYAVKVAQTDVGAGQQLQLTIEGVTSLTDLVALQKVFGSMLTVRQFSVLQYQAPQVLLKLELATTVADFYRALALESQLKPLTLPAASSVVASAESPVATDITEDLTTAEQAMAAALGVEEAPIVDAETATVPTDVVTAPVEATHYQFTRR
jgi:hypothetical protein